MQINTDGSRDQTFDSNGPGFNDQVTSLVRQPDGKLLVGWFTQSVSIRGESPRSKLNDKRLGGIGRLNLNGTADTAFNSPFDDASSVQYIALQTDGKIIVQGTFRLIGPSTNQAFNFARLNADGSLDMTFHPPSGAGATFAAIQPDGKIITSEFLNATSTQLERLNPDGSRDNTFSVFLPNGVATVNAILPDGRMIITGSFFLADGRAARIARLNTNGSFDATFDPGSGPDNTILSFVLEPDGKIIIGGKFFTYNGTAQNRIARLNPNGGLDTSFNPFNPNNRGIGALALQPDGKILVGENDVNNLLLPVRVFRLNPDGQLDLSFPITNSGIEPVNGAVNTIFLQPDGNFVIGGQFDVAFGVAEQALARIIVANVPTAAVVSVSGNVTTPDGSGLRNAVVNIIDSQGMKRRVTTSSFGLYSFDNVPTGQTYTIRVFSKLYRFAPRSLPVNNSLTGVDFVGIE